MRVWRDEDDPSDIDAVEVCRFSTDLFVVRRMVSAFGYRHFSVAKPEGATYSILCSLTMHGPCLYDIMPMTSTLRIGDRIEPQWAGLLRWFVESTGCDLLDPRCRSGVRGEVTAQTLLDVNPIPGTLAIPAEELEVLALLGQGAPWTWENEPFAHWMMERLDQDVGRDTSPGR